MVALRGEIAALSKQVERLSRDRSNNRSRRRAQHQIALSEFFKDTRKSDNKGDQMDYPSRTGFFVLAKCADAFLLAHRKPDAGCYCTNCFRPCYPKGLPPADFRSVYSMSHLVIRGYYKVIRSRFCVCPSARGIFIHPNHGTWEHSEIRKQLAEPQPRNAPYSVIHCRDLAFIFTEELSSNQELSTCIFQEDVQL
ncbi:hypothetical protein NPIL_341361 [Nephila pilipes]|uniref:Uncharacterized protein n=1 Tax=Nephila pilipes TaxID=299642 RepID=A0A8X6NZI2_NEPPI|nr:hypothetical protein NPIL_341361 [Nephila pilipes]